MLEIDQLCVRAGGFRLSGISLRAALGRSHVILGPSGSGKTTLLETIIGFRHPTSGGIRLSDLPLIGLPIERRDIGYLPQRLALFPHLSVRENLAYGERMRRQARGDTRRILDELVMAADIGHLLDRRPESLSGGERQRVALVRALAARPQLLLLDEPFSALNDTLRRELWRLVKALQAEHGFTTVMITHDLAEAFFMGDDITVMIEGRVQQSGVKETVWYRPATVEVAHYLGIHNLFSGVVTNGEPSAHDGPEGSRIACIECPSLGGIVSIPQPAGAPTWRSGSAVTLGIRPEFVRLHRAADAVGPDELLLDGRIAEVWATGAETALLVQCQVPSTPDPSAGKSRGTPSLIELRIGAGALRDRIFVTGESIQISLPTKDLFACSDPAPPPADEGQSGAP